MPLVPSEVLSREQGQVVIQSAMAIMREVYGGVAGPLETDADKLFGLANWLDRIDNLTDAMMARIGKQEKVNRDIQETLRRLSKELEQ